MKPNTILEAIESAIRYVQVTWHPPTYKTKADERICEILQYIVDKARDLDYGDGD